VSDRVGLDKRKLNLLDRLLQDVYLNIGLTHGSLRRCDPYFIVCGTFLYSLCSLENITGHAQQEFKSSKLVFGQPITFALLVDQIISMQKSCQPPCHHDSSLVPSCTGRPSARAVVVVEQQSSASQSWKPRNVNLTIRGGQQ
jgi:hypothetical protein